MTINITFVISYSITATIIMIQHNNTYTKNNKNGDNAFYYYY